MAFAHEYVAESPDAVFVKAEAVGGIPHLAGRSPIYLVRELMLVRFGARSNPGAAPMRMQVSHPALQDMVDVAAYTGARKS